MTQCLKIPVILVGHKRMFISFVIRLFLVNAFVYEMDVFGIFDVFSEEIIVDCDRANVTMP